MMSNSPLITKDLKELAKLDLQLAESEWYQFRTRKRLIDDAIHIQTKLLFWAVKISEEERRRRVNEKL